MKYLSNLAALALVSAIGLGATAKDASATSYSFVGSWDVSDGPDWRSTPPDGPLAYTGQEAAALLFGGIASDYAISTVDALIVNIDNMAHYDQIGLGHGVFAEDYDFKYLDEYYGPTSGYVTPYASAYISDNLVGSGFVNYAFRVSLVPLPAAGFLLIGALGGTALLGRRRKTTA